MIKSSVLLVSVSTLIALSACGAGGAPVGKDGGNQTVIAQNTESSPTLQGSPTATPESTSPSDPVASKTAQTQTTSATENASGTAVNGLAAAIDAIVAPTPNAGAASVGEHQTQKLSSISGELYVSCNNGGTVDIESGGSTIHVAGHCEALKITGNSNTIAAANVDVLTLDGGGNDLTSESAATVVLKGSSNSLLVGELGSLTITGGGNNVGAAKLVQIKFDGNSNDVTFLGSRPSVAVDGGGNTVKEG